MSLKVFTVIKREYASRAKTKGFIIGTFIFPIVLSLIFGGYFIFRSLFSPSTKTYYIMDQTGRIYTEMTEILDDTLKNGQPEYRFINIEPSPDSLETVMTNLQEKILNKDIDGYLSIPADVVESLEVKYSARNVSDFDELEELSRALSRIVGNIRLENIGLPADTIRREMAKGRIRLVSRQVTDNGEIEKSGVSSFIISYILTYVIMLMIMINGQILMRSVIEEKSQRITETIISSVKPIELMLGKIAGICGLGLTQLAIFGGFVLLAVTYGEPIFKHLGVDTPEILDVIRQIHFTGPIFAFMIIFFLLGFVFYSALFAAVGAMVNTEDEGQQFMLPLIFLLTIGYFIMFTVARNPETTRAFWISLIPFFTPSVMFARIAVSDPILPSGAILSISVMCLSIVLLIILTAKIYRVGILMYGKKSSLKEAVKWIRYK